MALYTHPLQVAPSMWQWHNHSRFKRIRQSQQPACWDAGGLHQHACWSSHTQCACTLCCLLQVLEPPAGAGSTAGVAASAAAAAGLAVNSYSYK
jgi:hypothetical protein